MKYRVDLYPSDEGFAVSCPRLPGCWSQGSTEEEALDNIRIAIQEYLAAQLPGLDEERLDHLYVEVFVEPPPTVRGEALARIRRVLASLPPRDAEVLRYLRILLQRAKEKFRGIYADDAASRSQPADLDGQSEVRVL